MSRVRAKKSKLSARRKALVVAKAAAALKAEDPILLNVSRQTSFTDYFVIAHGNSARHVQSIADGVIEAIAANGSKPFGLEGEKDARWILIDWGEVVAHVFSREAREFYELERLWSDAKRVSFPPKPRKKSAARKKAR